MKTVLFACVHNAGRSQMASAYFSLLADPAKAKSISAGTQPSDHVHPQVIEVMKEDGVDLSGRTPRLLTDNVASEANFLITMGCGEACPVVPGAKRADWPLPDPAGKTIADVKIIRDEIGKRVIELIAANGWGRANGQPPKT